MTARKPLSNLGVTVAALVFAVAGGCDDMSMRDQPRVESYEASAFFSNGASGRPRIPGTVSRSASLVDRPPQPQMSMELLERGRERFNIYCTPCHGQAGYGDGMVVQRGYPHPPSYHDDRLRGITDAHLYSVIENGLGKMPAYRAQVNPSDRWAIVAYIRALQRSQDATIEDAPDRERERLQNEPLTMESDQP